MSRRSQPPPDLQQQQGVGQVEEEEIEGVGEGDEIMEDAQVGEGDYSMSVSKPPPPLSYRCASIGRGVICGTLYHLTDPAIAM